LIREKLVPRLKSKIAINIRSYGKISTVNTAFPHFISGSHPSAAPPAAMLATDIASRRPV